MRAQWLAAAVWLRDSAWSRDPEYLKPPSRRWPWLRVERWFGERRLPQDRPAARLELERPLEEGRRREGGGEEWAAMRRGWFFGANELK